MNDFGQTFLQATRPVRYAATAALAVLALFLLAIALNAWQNIGRPDMYPANTITVTGEGEAVAIPNVAVFTFTISEKGNTVAGVQDGVARISDQVVADLKALGIEDKDVRTMSYNIYPTYDYAPCYQGPCPAPTVTGYQADNNMEVKVRDTSKVGSVLESLGTKGLWSVSGPNFQVDDDEALLAEAREKAIDEAKAEAQALAKKLGVKLVRVVSFYENSPYYPMYDYGYGGEGMARDMAQEYKAPTLEPGEQETTVSVSITYEIR